MFLLLLLFMFYRDALLLQGLLEWEFQFLSLVFFLTFYFLYFSLYFFILTVGGRGGV